MLHSDTTSKKTGFPTASNGINSADASKDKIHNVPLKFFFVPSSLLIVVKLSQS